MTQEMQSQEQTVRYGVNSETLAEFVDFARENPADVQFELSAKGYCEGRAFHTLSKIGVPTRSVGRRSIARPVSTRSPSVRTRRSKPHSASLTRTTAPR